MATSPTPEALAQEARFVFRGTVEAVQASSMPDIVPASSDTCVVHVDDVLQSPQSLETAAGENVTVLLPTNKTVSPHEQSVFFTNPWLYGETLAVQAVDVRPVAATLAAVTTSAAGPVRTLVERDRQARIAAADLIVRGRVTAVRLVDTGEEVRHTEHAAQWQDAVVAVEAVEKGPNPGPEILIRFPASSDIKYLDRPKFTPGQEGRFILKRWAATDGAARPDVGPPLYTADNRYDFQSLQELLNVEPPTGLPPV
jgi:hypothetical protein